MWLGFAQGLLAGCGITFDVKHVGDNDLAKDMSARPGLYYSLPMTEVELTIPVTFELGRNESDLRACVLACNAKARSQCFARPGGLALRPHSPVIGAPTVVTRAVPDPAHRYRVNLSNVNPLLTVDHKFTLGADGVLKTAKLSAIDETASTFAGIVGGILPTGVAPPPPEAPANNANLLEWPPNAANDKKKHPTVEPICTARVSPMQQAQLERAALRSWADKAGPASCAVVTGFADKLEALGEAARCEVEFTRADVERLLHADKPIGVDEARLRTELAQQRAAELLASRKAILDALGFNRADESVTLRLKPATPIAPTPFEHWPDKVAERVCDLVSNDGVSSWCKVKAWVTSLSPGNDLERRKDLLTEAQRAVDRYRIRVLAPADVPRQGTVGTEPYRGALGHDPGYRYRMPAAGTVKFGWSDESGRTVETILSQEHAIAQHGAIAALPSYFSGLSASLSFELSSEGTLLSVGIGQEAKPTTEAFKEMTTLPAAIVEAKAQRQQSQIDAAKRQRCLDALKSTTDLKEWPAVCQ